MYPDNSSGGSGRQTSLSQGSEEEKSKRSYWPIVVTVLAGSALLLSLYNMFSSSRKYDGLASKSAASDSSFNFQKNTQAGINNSLASQIGTIKEDDSLKHNYLYGQTNSLKERVDALSAVLANTSSGLENKIDSQEVAITGLQKNVVTQSQFDEEKRRIDSFLADLGKRDDNLLADANLYTDLSTGKGDSVNNVIVNAVVDRFKGWQEEFRILIHNYLGAGFGFNSPTVDPEGRVRNYFKAPAAKEELMNYTIFCLRSKKDISMHDPKIKHFAYEAFNSTLNSTWANPLRLSNAGAADKSDPNWLPGLDKSGK